MYMSQVLEVEMCFCLLHIFSSWAKHSWNKMTLCAIRHLRRLLKKATNRRLNVLLLIKCFCSEKPFFLQNIWCDTSPPGIIVWNTPLTPFFSDTLRKLNGSGSSNRQNRDGPALLQSQQVQSITTGLMDWCGGRCQGFLYPCESVYSWTQ